MNLRSGELYRGDECIRLQEQPLKALRMLLEAPGQVVTREELRKGLWGDHTYVDFDHGINVAMAKVREALGDSSKKPQFIVTVGRHGYRFVAAVEPVAEEIAPSPRRKPMPAGAAAARPRSVGRDKEHAELTAALECVASGRGLLVCVDGEPGIGKTTLVEDFLSNLHSSGRSFLLAKGRCSERLAGSEAYLPVVEALESLVRGDGAGTRAQLRALAPSWYAQLFPLSMSDPSDARLQAYVWTTTQERVKRELAAFLHEVTHQAPLVLFLDDVHWADPSTVDLLAYLATKLEATRLLVIVAYRASELFISKHPIIGVKRELQARAMCREVAVELLSLEDVERYIALEFPRNRFPRELATVIHSRTEGNPLFMVDLLRYIRDREVIVQREEQVWHLARPLPESSRELPQARGVIERKIEQVGDRDREVLSAAAVEGYEFDSAAIARALRADSPEVEESLDRLDHVHAFVKLVSEDELPCGAPTVRYRFVHVLYQDALYGSLTPARRALLASALARALEDLHGDKSSTIASQLAFLHETARDPGRASDYYRLAATNAQRIFANQEAVALAQRGLALLAKTAETPERIRNERDLRVTLAFSLILARGYGVQEVQENLVRAKELCQASGDIAQLFQVLFGLWLHQIAAPELQAARRTGEQLLEIARSDGDPARLLAAHGLLGITLLYKGELAAAHEHFEEARRHHRPEEHRRYLELYRLEVGISWRALTIPTFWMLGYPDKARRELEETLALGYTIPSPPSLALTLVHAASLHLQLRQPDEARAAAEECLALCDEHGVAQERLLVTPRYGSALALLGQVEEGSRHIHAALDAQRSLGSQIARPQFLWYLAEVHWRLGQVEEGLEALEDGLDMSKRTDQAYYDAELWRLKGELVKTQGKPAEAELCFRKAIEIARRQASRSFELRASTSLARLWQGQGKRTEARQVLGDIHAWFTEGFDTADLQEASSLLKDLS